MNRTQVSLGLLAFLTTLQTVQAESFSFSGFGSLVGGTVLSGDGYWARLPDAAGQYNQGIEFQTESRLGLQGRYRISDQLSVTSQIMIRGVNDFEPEMEWFYASYSITPDMTANLGLMRLPVYRYSDYMDVGISFPWVRVPSDAYSLALTNFQGVSLQYNFDWDIGTTALKIYGGQQDTDPNKLLTTIEQYKANQLYDADGNFRGVRGIHLTKDYKDMKGIVLDTTVEWFNLRVSYLAGKENFTFYDEGGYPSTPLFGGQWTDTRFLDLSFSVDYDNLLIVSEWNKYEDIYTSWFSSFAYRLGDLGAGHHCQW